MPAAWHPNLGATWRRLSCVCAGMLCAGTAVVALVVLSCYEKLVERMLCCSFCAAICVFVLHNGVVSCLPRTAISCLPPKKNKKTGDAESPEICGVVPRVASLLATAPPPEGVVVPMAAEGVGLWIAGVERRGGGGKGSCGGSAGVNGEGFARAEGRQGGAGGEASPGLEQCVFFVCVCVLGRYR